MATPARASSGAGPHGASPEPGKAGAGRKRRPSARARGAVFSGPPSTPRDLPDPQNFPQITLPFLLG